MGSIPAFSPDLLASAVQGDEAAVEELAKELSGPVYFFCLAMLKNSQLAEDAGQEALFKIISSLKGFRGQAAFSSWAYSIISNHCLDMLRKGSRRAEVSLEECCSCGFEPGLPSEARAVEARLLLEAAMEKLSPEHRAVLAMRELAGLSYEEIAESLGCSEGTVKSRLFRAREELRTALEPEEGPELERPGRQSVPV